ncbi:hypothetical protein AALO_G00244710 [Alosa alosa]|uniref:Uncharacterized protein n=1 Tax=Alosa alosa TaxID=278164 RepID=A0AAV6FWS2_9TELE|nr:syncoilin-like [Alosa alosa]KAG5265640.1 hypothetical protein AALO_G00244710 [Alosa alosa]
MSGARAEAYMPSVGGELEGEPQPTQGVASDYPWTGNPVGITEDKQVHVHITDSVHPLFVEMCSPSPVQTTSRVTSAPLSAQASAPASMEPSAPGPMQTSSCVAAQTLASLSEHLTPQLPMQCSRSPSPPLTGVFTIQAQTSASLTETVSHPPQAVLSVPGQVSAPHLTQTPPLTPAQSCASLAMQISPLCFALLPVQTSPPPQWAVEEEVAAHFGTCLEEVGVLERRREALVHELLQLEQPMMEAVRAVRAELAQAYGRLTRAQLQLLWRQEDVRQVKRKLLNVTRHSIQSQVDLSALQYEVAQSVIMQEELQSQVLDHLQEVAQLREDHKKQMDSQQNNLKKRRRRRTMSDLSHCRRFSADLSSYTCGSMKMLEDWYEPRVLALLRRRQTAEEVLRRSRELTEELRTRLLPLQEEAHKLSLQRKCLEQKIALMEREREESATQYKESIFYLEETMRELKADLQMQRMANAELKQLKNSLLLELQSYGCSISISEHTDMASGGGEDL